MEKTIIFCRTYNDCSQLFLFFRDVLEEEITDPIGFPDIAKFRLVDMFTACSTPKLKASILKSFSSINSWLRVVVATVAFGMGIDCSDVRYIYHWSPPSDIETCVSSEFRKLAMFSTTCTLEYLSFLTPPKLSISLSPTILMCDDLMVH